MGKKDKKGIQFPKLEISLKLRIAKKHDFLDVEDSLPNGKTKWKMRLGVPFWLINSKGNIENKNYILTENTDKFDFADWLNKEQVLIPRENEKQKK